MKYRKKPIVIEATQWHGFNEGPYDLGVVRAPSDRELPLDMGWIGTLEGGHEVTPGDWIITGVEGERYPCKPSVFNATYDLA